MEMCSRFKISSLPIPASEFVKGTALIISQEDALSEDLGKPLLHSNHYEKQLNVRFSQVTPYV